MARPVETAFAYFPLDCNFFTNEKVKALRRAYGSTGVLAYIFILCKIYDSGYYYRVKNLDSFAHDIAESIANKQLDTVAARIRESIDYMADSADLLDRSCLDMGILTSKAIQEQYSVTIAKFRRKTQIKEYSLLTPLLPVEEITVNAEETAVNVTETAVNAEKTPRKRNGKRNENFSKERYRETPTLEDIQAYCSERKNGIKPQRFFDYYSATDWIVRGQPVTDWRALVRTWESTERKQGKNASDRDNQERVSSKTLDELFTNITGE